MRLKNLFFCLPAITILLLASCGNSRKVNISGIKVDIKIKRLETDLFTINPAEVKKDIPYCAKNMMDF